MRARNIKPGFFTNELLGQANPIVALLFAGLWCLADKNGVLEDRPMRIKAEVFPYRNIDPVVFNGYLSELEGYGLIARYQAERQNLIIITGFRKHQSPHHTEKNGTLPLPSDEVVGGCAITVNPRAMTGEYPPDSLIHPFTDSLIHPTPLPPTGGVAEVAVKEKKKAKPRGRSYDIEALHLTETDEDEAMKVWNAWPQTGWNFSTKTEAPRRINKALFLERFSEILRHSPIRKADDSKLTSSDLAGSAIQFVEYRKKEARQNGSTIPNVPCIANFFSSVENEKNPWKDAVLAYFEGGS